MKILIVGAGIGGLSAYLALKKHLDPTSHTVTLVEAYPSPSQHTYSLLGNGLGLAPNGLRAINSITKSALPYIYSHSYTKGSFMTFRNSKAKTLGSMGFGKEDRYGYPMCMLPRAIVHEALLDEIEPTDILWGVRVVGLRELDDDDEGAILVQYEDGSEVKVDLVIGADGVRSVVKNYLFGSNYEAQYDGLTGVGAFLPVSELPETFQKSLHTEGVSMIFGNNGFFGFSLFSPFPVSDSSTSEPFIGWWSIYETETIPDKKNIDYEDIKNQLIRRHGEWASPYDGRTNSTKTIRTLIELSFKETPTSSIPRKPIVLPRYVTPRLPAWSNATYPNSTTNIKNKGRIVLIGDAAHTMPPDVGQGVSCAAEDSVVYALLLSHFLSQSRDNATATHTVLKRSAEAYELIRQPRIHRILDQAKYNASAKKEMGAVSAWVRDTMMWILCKLPERIHDTMFAYDAEVVVSNFLSKSGDKIKQG